MPKADVADVERMLKLLALVAGSCSRPVDDEDGQQDETKQNDKDQ